MAALPENDRAKVWSDLMADLSRVNEPCDVTKTELRATVAALDAFVVANAAAINNAIPAGPRASLTTSQKARILSAVVLRRYATGA